MREYLAQANKLSNVYQKQEWLLDSVEVYFKAIQRLVSEVANANPVSH
jgi:hypothetical protein